MPMTQAIRSRGAFVATMILTVMLAFPLARISAAPAHVERSTQARNIANPVPPDVRDLTTGAPTSSFVVRSVIRSFEAASDVTMPNVTRPEPASAPAVAAPAVAAPAVAAPAVAQGRAAGTPSRICKIDWRDGPRQVQRLVRCAARHFRVSVETALYVADRESNFLPQAYNTSSCAKGIFQHLCRYWPDRSVDFGFRGWSAFNARANIIVTMKMVRRYGWEPWGG